MYSKFQKVIRYDLQVWYQRFIFFYEILSNYAGTREIRSAATTCFARPQEEMQTDADIRSVECTQFKPRERQRVCFFKVVNSGNPFRLQHVTVWWCAKEEAYLGTFRLSVERCTGSTKNGVTRQQFSPAPTARRVQHGRRRYFWPRPLLYVL